jgi:TrmH family RNA methyltransferase
VAEGTELVRTALLAGVLPESLYLDTGASASGDEVADEVAARGVRVFELAPGVLAKVSDTVTPQPVVAVFPMVHVPLAEFPSDGLVVVLADVRDPGNAGTMVRTADAAGASGVVCTADTVDLYNPKTVRSTAGSLFHLPVAVDPDAGTVLGTLRARGFRCVGSVAHDGEDYDRTDWRRPTAVVFGNEAGGLPEGLELDGLVGIPMAGQAESLNVAIACGVLCFEALRQRRRGRPEDPGARPTISR